MATNPNTAGSLSYDAYRSPGTVTGSNPSNFVQTAAPPYLGGTGVNSNQLTRVYNPSDASGTDLSVNANHTALPAQTAPAFKPPYWTRRYDYYANYQHAGQPWMDNVNQPSPAEATVTGGPAVSPDPDPLTTAYTALYIGGPIAQTH